MKKCITATVAHRTFVEEGEEVVVVFHTTDAEGRHIVALHPHLVVPLPSAVPVRVLFQHSEIGINTIQVHRRKRND